MTFFASFVAIKSVWIVRISHSLLCPAFITCTFAVCYRQASFQDGSGPDGEVWSTYTQISGQLYGIILAADLKAPFSLTPQGAGFDQFVSSLIFGFPRVNLVIFLGA